MPDHRALGARRVAYFLAQLQQSHARYFIGMSDVTRILLIRHADAYEGLRDLPPGLVDPALSSLGTRQARRLADRLSELPLCGIWTSDLRRARETADIVLAGRTGVCRRVDPRLREIRGAYDEQRLPTPGTGTRPAIESDSAAAARMVSVVEEVMSAASPRTRYAAVVTHSDIIMAYLASLIGMRRASWKMMLGFTSVSVVAGKGARLVVESIGDISHLFAVPPSVSEPTTDG